MNKKFLQANANYSPSIRHLRNKVIVSTSTTSTTAAATTTTTTSTIVDVDISNTTTALVSSTNQNNAVTCETYVEISGSELGEAAEEEDVDDEDTGDEYFEESELYLRSEEVIGNVAETDSFETPEPLTIGKTTHGRPN